MAERRISCLGLLGLIFIIAIPNCRNTPHADLVKFKIISEIGDNRSSPFFIDFRNYPKQRKPLPIGIFDSGTGGLTVLDSILKIDKHNNRTRAPGPDGIPDFKEESFIYLGDKANMPYGSYQAEGKADFLRELVIKDVRFLLGKQYYQSPDDGAPRTDKEQVKAIVIACNTATAFGFDLLDKAVKKWKLDIPVMGIIDAGVKKTIERLPTDIDKIVIGIMATEGTCATGGYPQAFKKYHKPKFESKNINIVQQAGFGLAAAIDGDANYINPAAQEVRGKGKYYGPRLDHPWYGIDQNLWPQYNFSEKGLLIKRNQKGELLQVELNSAANYIKYHVTHLVVNAANQFPEGRITAIILGCTHYPFFSREIRDHFNYLRTANKKYHQIIAENLMIIDPANALAVELYQHLVKQQLVRVSAARGSRFYISVANPHLKENQINSMDGFPFSYKYGREINRHLEFVKRVPFSNKSLTPDVLQRIKEKIPLIFDMIFSQE